MFNPHHQQQHHHQQQQQQQQFHHHLRQLQQLFQHQPPPPPPPPPPPQPPPSHHVPHHHHHHHHQGGRAMTVTAPAPPPPRMVNLAAQATIMAPNPMLQGALLMQQMQGSMRGFAAMSGQQFTQFFAAGARSSLLGPVPMGVAIKTPHMGFPARHYHPHARYYNNDYASRQPDRKRANEQRASGSTDGQPAASGTAEDSSDKALKDGRVGGPDGQAQPSVQAEPEEPVLKKQRTEGLEGTAEQPAETDSVLTTAQYKRPTESQPGVCVILHEGGSMAGPEAAEALEESRAAQVQSEMSAMPASEPLSAESQAFTPCLDMAEGTAAQETSEGGQEEATAAPGLLAEGQEEGGDAANKFYCYICNITCHNQQIFQSHMNGLAHQQRMMEIQHMSNACLVTLLPRVQESLQGGRRDASSFRDGEKRPGLQRWCATCQIHFTCPVMEHRKTREHKLFSRASSPSCTVCKRDFRSPRLFLEHMQSQEHKLRVDKLREEGGPDSLAELVAMDTYGCCVADGEEEEEEEEGDEDEDDREDGGEGSAHGKEPWPTQMEVALLEDVAEDEEYDPDTVYGSSFVVPMAGFLCRLCQRFYHFESAARQSHCKSLQHFENLKKYRALRSQKESQVEPTPANMDGEAECDSNHTVSDSKRLSPELLTSPSLLRPTMSTPIPRPSRCCTEPQENAPSASCLSQQDPTTTSSSPTTSSPEGTAAEASPEQQSPVGPEDKEETPNPDLAPEDESGLVTAEMEEAEAAAPEEKTGKGKAKGSSKRRYGRTTRRR